MIITLNPAQPQKFFNALAMQLVGDGNSPNIYFVCDSKGDTKMITLDFNAAYDFWHSLPATAERTLEDRKYGVICSTEPESDIQGARLCTRDESAEYRRRNRIPAR